MLLKKAVTVPILFFRVTSLLVTHVSACLRPVQQVESRNKTSDIHRPFCLFLCASSPWIKFKETHRLFQKFRFAKEVLFFLSDTYYGRKITLYRSYDMYFKYFLLVIESEELSFLHVFKKTFYYFSYCCHFTIYKQLIAKIKMDSSRKVNQKCKKE